MDILLIDNDDSFTFNLFQQIASLGAKVEVIKHSELKKIQAENYKAIVISPGPKGPTDYPEYKEIIKNYDKPILGVCLGHQIIGEYFGSKTVRAPKVMHGKTSLINHTGTSLFKNIKNPMKVARYHSLVVSEVPKNFQRLAWTEDGILMAMAHETKPLFGVQFHPESFLTEDGNMLMQNFLNLANINLTNGHPEHT